jgi:hypothetical protein
MLPSNLATNTFLLSQDIRDDRIETESDRQLRASSEKIQKPGFISIFERNE